MEEDNEDSEEGNGLIIGERDERRRLKCFGVIRKRNG